MRRQRPRLLCFAVVLVTTTLLFLQFCFQKTFIRSIQFSTIQDNISFDSTFLDILPRSVYFDNRPRDGHRNAIVFLVQISKTALNRTLVVGCGVDNVFTENFKLEVMSQYFWINSMARHTHLTHNEAMLTCYDLPAQQGSRAFVYYTEEKTGQMLKLETERRLYIPSKRNGKKSSIMVCTTMYGNPPWLREWLIYQKTIGVDFIHINAQESFIGNSILNAYLESGYAQVDVWKSYLNASQIYYFQQILLYVDCLYRYQTVFDYALFYDTDDFFMPVLPGITDLHYYVENILFHDKKVAAAKFNWIFFHPDCGLTLDPKTIEDGNITKYLKDPKAEKPSGNHKSIYRILGVVDVQIHAVGKMMPGYKHYYTSTNVAYVAHLRLGTLKPSQCIKLE